LIRLQILAEQIAAIRDLRSGDDQSILPRKPVTILSRPGSLDHPRIHRQWRPSEARPNVARRVVTIQTRPQLFGDRPVELLKHLDAEPAGATSRRGYPEPGCFSVFAERLKYCCMAAP
jgi:hypothetical protein